MSFLGGLSSLGSVFSGVGGWLGKSGGLGSSNAFAALGALGSLYSAYEQNKMAKKMFNMQKDAYDFNKMLSQRELQRQNQAQQNLNTAWNNSAFSKSYNDGEEQ